VSEIVVPMTIGPSQEFCAAAAGEDPLAASAAPMAIALQSFFKLTFSPV
jgi:hypothetical protein